ncbi:MAG: hypothetical protein D6693_00715, partial [Planctomycetota bacterium]
MADREQNRKPLARALGEFVGHIWRGATRDLSRERREVRRTVEHEERDTPRGRVTLRRTTIEEIEVR